MWLKKLICRFFENYVIKKYQNSLSINGDGKCNIWYILMYYSFLYENENDETIFIGKIRNGNPLWMDVENYIKNVVIRNGKESLHFYIDNYGRPKSLLDGLSRLLSNPTLYDKDLQGEEQSFSKNVLRNHFVNLGSQNYSNIYHYLFEELLLFENDFCKYLSQRIMKSKSYYPKSENLIRKLIGNSDCKTYLLTFNYTTPLNDERLSYYCGDGINHAHGSINDKNVVIGYNSDSVPNSNEGEMLFGKTYQRILKEVENRDYPDPKFLKQIKFYGLSLNEADYSYFFYLFDQYDLVDGDVQLIFYYKNYKKTEIENRKNKSELVVKINKLINSYADKANSEGKDACSLFTKLSIDNRLVIIDIDTI